MSLFSGSLLTSLAQQFYGKCDLVDAQTERLLTAINSDAQVGPRMIVEWNNSVFGLKGFAEANGGDPRFRDAVAASYGLGINFLVVPYYQALVAAATPAVQWMVTKVLQGGKLDGWIRDDNNMLVPCTVSGSTLAGWTPALTALKAAFEADASFTA